MPENNHQAVNSEEKTLRVGSPAGLLALIPQLLGFEPHDSIVLLGAEPANGRVRLTIRHDLPAESDPVEAWALAHHALQTLAAHGFTSGVAVGYGPGARVTPLADAIRAHAASTGFALAEVLRAHDGRYWSYLCTDPTCCSPARVPYDAGSDPVTAAFAAAGAPPVLGSRDDLAASVAPVSGDAAQAMDQAIQDATERASRLATRRQGVPDAGRTANIDAIGSYRKGGQTSPEEDAWLLVLLRDLRVRDDAWSRMDPGHRDAHLKLWTHLTRVARPGYVAAPASLLAYVAWQAGNGALANVALDRAQDDDPAYTLARLLRDAIDTAMPPSHARPPMNPEQVATSYDAGEQDNGGQPGRNPGDDFHDGDHPNRDGDAGPDDDANLGQGDDQLAR